MLLGLFNRSEGLALTTVTGVVVSRGGNIDRMGYISILHIGIAGQSGCRHCGGQAAQ